MADTRPPSWPSHGLASAPGDRSRLGDALPLRCRRAAEPDWSTSCSQAGTGAGPVHDYAPSPSPPPGPSPSWSERACRNPRVLVPRPCGAGQDTAGARSQAVVTPRRTGASMNLLRGILVPFAVRPPPCARAPGGAFGDPKHWPGACAPMAPGRLLAHRAAGRMAFVLVPCSCSSPHADRRKGSSRQRREGPCTKVTFAFGNIVPPPESGVTLSDVCVHGSRILAPPGSGKHPPGLERLRCAGFLSGCPRRRASGSCSSSPSSPVSPPSRPASPPPPAWR